MWARWDDRAIALQDDIRALVAANPGRVGVYARNLTTGETVDVDGDVELPTESAIKTAILVHYSMLITEDQRDPQARVVLTADDRVLGSGVLRYLSEGLRLSLEDLAWLMIIVSDNVATHVLLRAVGGREAVNARMAALGLRDLRLNPRFSHTDMMTAEPFGTGTAHDLAELYTHLDERCRQILFRQQFVDFLPRRVPHASGATDFGITMPVRVYNKTGGGFLTCTDSARFETDTAAWVVAALAADQHDLAMHADDAAPSLFAEIGERLYDAWSNPS